MTREVTCDWLNLEYGVDALLTDIGPEMDRHLGKEIPKVGRKGARELRKTASERWKGKTGGQYSAGFSNRSKTVAHAHTSEIGNKTFPGLVHLLEKGHNTPAGRRIAGNPHLVPIYEEVVVPELEKAVEQAVDAALEG